MADEIFTVAQTAEYLQVCEKTVLRLIKRNTLTASKIGNRSWRIRKIDIDSYLEGTQNKINGGMRDGK